MADLATLRATAKRSYHADGLVRMERMELPHPVRAALTVSRLTQPGTDACRVHGRQRQQQP
jgi:hypothetical protein